jgi:outer membrane translocation and assembly module TamA
MPDNDLAQTAYEKALEAALSKPGHALLPEVKREADVYAHTMIVVFRDANAPKLTALQFEGNHAIDSATLEQALHGIVIGEPYSERELSTVVGLNLVRLYDRKGYLRAAFPKVTRVNPGAPEAIARVSIEEGPCFRLNEMQFVGEDLPESAMRKAAALHPGKPANWDEITVGTELARRVLTSLGYVKASYELQRVFPVSSETVDVRMVVNKGPQYMFGDLLFDGVDPDHQDLLSRRFEIRSGAPVDEQYVYNFKSQIYALAGRRVKAVGMRYLAHGSASNVLDVKYDIH